MGILIMPWPPFAVEYCAGATIGAIKSLYSSIQSIMQQASRTYSSPYQKTNAWIAHAKT